jgi:hypothetical protein
LKKTDVLFSENSKRIIVAILIVVLGTLMAARKQFVVDIGQTIFSYEYALVEGHEKELGHIHSHFHKDAFAPPGLLWFPYSLHFSKAFHITSAVIYWIFVIALVVLIIRQVGFGYYFSIVLTMYVLFVGNLVTREMFEIPLLGPAPNLGYQHFDYRIFTVLLSLASILSAFRGRLILSGLLIGLATVMHLKYGLRMFGLLMSCIILWNLWGCRQAKAPHLKIPWKLVAGFGCCWVVQFVAMYLYIRKSLNFFTELDVPRVDAPFLSRLGWLIKNEMDDWTISFTFYSDVSFFGFLLLAVVTLFLCELIRRRMDDIRQKILAVILILSVFIGLLFFGFGFLFDSLLIHYLPLSLSTPLMLTRGWDLIWVVIVAFTIAVFLCTMLLAKNIGRNFQQPPLAIQTLFLNVAFTVFVLFNVYIFIDKKDGSLFNKRDLDRPYLNMPYIQICTDDTALYERTLEKLWKLAGKKDETEFHEQLQILENIFDRTLKPTKIEETNNQDVKNLQILNDLKSNRYRLAIQKLSEASHAQDYSSYFWSCDNKGLGLHRRHVEIPFQDFYDVSQWVNKNTPVDRGVIAPPYSPAKFDLHSQRVTFWDHKRDGHMMYMVKEYHLIGLHRLETLAGPYAVLMAPGIRNGRVGLRGRAHFLSLQQEDFFRIKERYPHYDYLVTENQALSGFRMLYSNQSLAVYDISEKFE